MEKEIKSYMSNVDEVINLLKQKIERIEEERDEIKAKYDNILATESGHESQTENVWQSGYAAGHETGMERGKREATAPLTPGAPTTPGTYFASIKSFAGYTDEMVVLHHQKDKGVYYAYGQFSRPVKAEDIIGHIPREGHGMVEVSEDAHEKEIMMQAFDKVRQIFEGRQWVMDGRGSYPYNDDRYKEEVRYMYNEFDEVVKDTWANIKSKSVDYRKEIIAEYLATPAGRGEDAVAFAEELWDNHSVLIGEDIVTLEQYANREVMKKDDFIKAIAAFKQHNP